MKKINPHAMTESDKRHLRKWALEEAIRTDRSGDGDLVVKIATAFEKFVMRK